MAYKASSIPDFRALARKVSKAAREELVVQLDQYAETQAADFRERIEQQRFASFKEVRYPDSPHWNRNLSPIWFRRKVAKAADERTMIATRTYVDSIRVFRKLDPKGGGLWRVGFHPYKRARDLDNKIVDITLNDLALIHEHGTASMAARPHWKPNLNRMRREAPGYRRGMRAAILKQVKQAVKGGMVVKVS